MSCDNEHVALTVVRHWSLQRVQISYTSHRSIHTLSCFTDYILMNIWYPVFLVSRRKRHVSFTLWLYAVHSKNLSQLIFTCIFTALYRSSDNFSGKCGYRIRTQIFMLFANANPVVSYRSITTFFVKRDWSDGGQSRE